MTITWPTSGTTICDGADRAAGKACGPDSLAIRRVPALIRRAPVEGPGPNYEEAGNDEVTVSFGVYVRCADSAAAATKVAAIAATAAVGELAMSDSLTVKDAGLLSIDVRQSGVGVRATYTIGGHL